MFKFLHKKPSTQSKPTSSDPILSKRKEFYSTFINSGDLCFDVGANMGNRVEPLLQIGARVVAVEPQEKCITALQAKFGNRITIVPKGLSESEGMMKLHISNAHTISSYSEEWISAVKDERFKGYQWDKEVETEMTTLDKLIEIYGVPAFIKIDVEGYELEVLKGLSTPVGMISFEYTVPEQTEKAIACIQQIEKHNSTIVCNYSVGESMELELTSWLSPAEMYTFIRSAQFTNSNFGDIYVKKVSYRE